MYCYGWKNWFDIDCDIEGILMIGLLGFSNCFDLVYLFFGVEF